MAKVDDDDKAGKKKEMRLIRPASSPLSVDKNPNLISQKQ
jgi:hypothetical protein